MTDEEKDNTKGNVESVEFIVDGERTVMNPEELKAAREDFDSDGDDQGTKLMVIGAFIGVALVSIAIAWLFVTVIEPAVNNFLADKELKVLVNQQGEVTVTNSNIANFDGEPIAGTNTEQKGLSRGGERADDPAAIVFGNGRDSDKKVLEVYLDFSSQQSRDFVLSNQVLLKGQLQTGKIELHIKPLPTNDPYSLYAGEALAEAAYVAPDKTWPFMLDLLRISMTNQNESRDATLATITKAAASNGINNVDSEGIRNGTFASWLFTIGGEVKVKQGFIPPLVYFDNKLVDPKTINLNNPYDMRRALEG